MTSPDGQTPRRRFPDPDLHAQFRAAVESGDCGENYRQFLEQEFESQEELLQGISSADINGRIGQYRYLAAIADEIDWYYEHQLHESQPTKYWLDIAVDILKDAIARDDRPLIQAKLDEIGRLISELP